MSKKIEIKCEGAALHEWKKLKDFQGDLKELTETGFNKLRARMIKKGFKAPFFVWKDHDFLLDGHQRIRVLEALEKEGYKIPAKLPTDFIIADTETEAKDDLLGFISQYGQTTDEGLYQFLHESNLIDSFSVLKDTIDLPGIDLEAFSDGYINDINETEGLTDDDAIPEDVESRCKTGDLWLLGNHRLFCGDATKADDVERLMDGEKADLVFTDPPYNVAYGDSSNPRYTAHTSGKHRLIENDNLDKDAWVSFNRSITDVFKQYSIGDIYVWGAPGPDGMRQRLTFIDCGLHWSATIIWKKQRLVLAAGKYQRMYEPCFYGWTKKSSFCGDRKNIEVWEVDRPHKSELHPTMKPIELCKKGITNSSKLNNIVLDVFGGSGSTLIACEKLNRKCFMMELDPIYCDVIIQRWQEFTRKEAKLSQRHPAN